MDFLLIFQIVSTTILYLALVCLPFYILLQYWDQSFSRIEKIGISLLAGPVIWSWVSFLLGTRIPFFEVTQLHLSGLLVAWNIPTILFLIKKIQRKSPLLDAHKFQKNEFFLTVAVILFLHLAAFALYRYLPEADGYSIVHSVRENSKNGVFGRIGYRPLFPALVQTISTLSYLDPLYVLQWMIPVWLTSIFTITWKALSRRTPAYLFPFFLTAIPVIFSEILYARPQSVIIALAAVTILILRKQTGPRLIGAFLLSLTCYPFHEFAIFISAAILLFSFPFIYRAIRTDTKSSLLHIIYLGVITLLLLSLPQTQALLATFRNIFADHQPRFIPWFITNYTTIDGTQLGWPGMSWLLFYGYNLGFLLPLSFVFYKRRNLTSTGFLFSLFTVFFIIAEVVPRFGLPSFPDRAWLYGAIALVTIAITLLEKTSRRQQIIIGLAVVLGTLTTAFIISRKQGWTQQSDIQSISTIRPLIDARSVLITQAGSTPAFQVYGEMNTLSVTNFFSMSPDERVDILARIKQGDGELTQSQVDIATTAETAVTAREAISLMASSIDQSSLQFYTTYTTAQIRQLERLRLLDLRKQAPTKKDPPSDIYILYSTGKFTGLYGSREWWRTLNEYNANLASIDQTPGVTPVFTDGTTRIWKYSHE